MQVGRVGRPHGLDGAFVVERGSEDESRYAVGSVLYIDGVRARSRSCGGSAVAARRSDSTARSSVARSSTIPRAELPALPRGRVNNFEIIGLRVEEEGGRSLGVVRDVLPGPANDNLELDDGTLVPMIEDAILAIDTANGIVLLNPGFIS